MLACAAVLNIFSSHLMAIMNNVSVWWHVVGASAIVLILIIIPDQHQSFSYVFTERFNNSGYADGSTSTMGFWFFIVPFGFLLTQYTITGFDACAHLSEETEAASTAAAQGHLAVDLLLRARRLRSCCWRSSSRSRTAPTVCPTTPVSVEVALRTSSSSRSASTGQASCCSSPRPHSSSAPRRA